MGSKVKLMLDGNTSDVYFVVVLAIKKVGVMLFFQ